MKFSKSLLLAIFTLAASPAFAHHTSPLRAPVQGYVVEPTSALAAISGNTGFADVDNNLAALQGKVNGLTAIASQSFDGDLTVYRVYLYSMNASGDLHAEALIEGQLVGGDEFTSSKPGKAQFVTLK